MKQEDFDVIERYISGEAIESEREYVESLFVNGESNLYLLKRLQKDWESIVKSDLTGQYDLTHLLDRIHHIINTYELNKRKKPVYKFMQFIKKTAAVLFIPLIVTSGLFCYRFFSYKSKVEANKEVLNTIYAPPASRVSFSLPDGTTGMLNGGSMLSFALPFVSSRQVTLQGEAWFEVKQDYKHPFEIKAGYSTVKVLGTSFNLNAYPNENFLEIVLSEGKVEFFESNNKKSVIVLPYERLIYHKGISTKVVVEPEKYKAWTEGKLIFRGDPMNEVARRIERWYNVKIIISDKEIEKYSFHATFQDDTLEDVMKYLTMTSPISYKITPREIMPDGTYTKKVVTIYKKKN